MDRRVEIENWETDETREFHRKQYIEPKRNTVAFDAFLARQGRMNDDRILDFGCGGAATDAYMASMHEGIHIDGIDIVDNFFYMFDEYADEGIKNRVSLKKADFYHLGDDFKNNYDGIISMQTISCMENWQKPIEKMCEVNPDWIGISALFYEGRIDYQIKIKDYEEKGVTREYTEKYYNIYSIPLVRDYLYSKGYTKFVYEPFEIDIDIPRPDHFNVGTYTVRTEDGHRMQISAALLMPWYFIYAAKE